MTALETLALGKPLIAHKVGGLIEVLANSSELLVSEHTAEGYSNKMLQIMKNPPLVTLETPYTSKANATSTLKLYQQIM